MKKETRGRILEAIAYIFISFLVVLIAINGVTPFKIPADGQIHLARYEQVFQSLRHLKVPAEISFIGPGHNLNAVISCYPWLGGFLFILPRFFIFKHIMVAIFIGFWLVNLLTALAIFYLIRTLRCTNRLLRICLVTYWLFNSYHLNLLYFRMAFGEFLAYAYLPLAVAGIIKIGRKEKRGIYPLVLGMSGIANSHLLSLLIVTLGIGGYELYGLVSGRFSKFEFKSLIISVLSSLVLASYSLWGIFYIQANNTVIVPFKNLSYVDLKQSIAAQLSGVITQNSSMWGIGIIGMILLVVVFVLSVKIKQIRSYIYICVLILIITYLPLSNYPKLIQYFGFIQFTGRLLTYVVLFQVMAMTILVREFSGRAIKAITVFCAISVVCLGAISVVKHEQGKLQENDGLESYVYTINSTNYYQEVQANNYGNFNDYLPGKGTMGSGPIYVHTDPWINMTQVKGTYDRAEFKLVSGKSGLGSLALARYKGISYQIRLNGKKVNLVNSDGIKLSIPKGISYLEVSSKPTTMTIIIFLASRISYLIFGITSLRCGGREKKVVI